MNYFCVMYESTKGTQTYFIKGNNAMDAITKTIKLPECIKVINVYERIYDLAWPGGGFVDPNK